MGRYIWANGKYVTIMNIPPPPFILLQKNEFGAHSVVSNNPVLCSAKIGVFSRKLIENVFTLIRKLAAGAIIASPTELAVIVINCIRHNSRNSVQDEITQIQVLDFLGLKFAKSKYKQQQNIR